MCSLAVSKEAGVMQESGVYLLPTPLLPSPPPASDHFLITPVLIPPCLSSLYPCLTGTAIAYSMRIPESILSSNP